MYGNAESSTSASTGRSTRTRTRSSQQHQPYPTLPIPQGYEPDQVELPSPMRSASSSGDMGNTTDFVKKLYKMLESPEYTPTVCWGPRGDCFVVRDTTEFTKKVLPKLFKHSNFASFVRQLNKYDFHKVKSDEGVGSTGTDGAWTFRHPKFTAQDKAALEDIKRKIPAQGKTKGAGTGMGKERALESPVAGGYGGGSGAGGGEVASLRSEVERLKAEVEELRGRMVELERRFAASAGQTYVPPTPSSASPTRDTGLDSSRKGRASDAYSAPQQQQPTRQYADLSSASSSPFPPPPPSTSNRQQQTYLEAGTSRNDSPTASSYATANTSGLSFPPQQQQASSPTAYPPTHPWARPDGELRRMEYQRDLDVDGAQEDGDEEGEEEMVMPSSGNANVRERDAGGVRDREEVVMPSNTYAMSQIRSAVSPPGTAPVSGSSRGQGQGQGQGRKYVPIQPKASTSAPVATTSGSMAAPSTSSTHKNARPSTRNATQWSSVPRVLLVDDDAVSRKLSAKFLEVFGCAFDVAQDGVGAVDLMQRLHPTRWITGGDEAGGEEKGKSYDLVLMDIVMPKLDGLSATSLIRKFDARTPIISMTSNSRPDEVLAYYSNGMNDVLAKPFTKDRLFGILQKHLTHMLKFTVSAAAATGMRLPPQMPGHPPLNDAGFEAALHSGARSLLPPPSSASSSYGEVVVPSQNPNPYYSGAREQQQQYMTDGLGTGEQTYNPLAGMGLNDEAYGQILEGMVASSPQSAPGLFGFAAPGTGTGFGFNVGGWSGEKRPWDEMVGGAAGVDGREEKRGRFEVIE